MTLAYLPLKSVTLCINEENEPCSTSYGSLVAIMRLSIGPEKYWSWFESNAISEWLWSDLLSSSHLSLPDLIFFRSMNRMGKSGLTDIAVKPSGHSSLTEMGNHLIWVCDESKLALGHTGEIMWWAKYNFLLGQWMEILSAWLFCHLLLVRKIGSELYQIHLYLDARHVTSVGNV